MVPRKSFLKTVLKTGLVTASTTAMLLGSSNVFGAAVILNRTTTANNANLNTGAGLDQNAGHNNVIFAHDSVLTLGGGHNINANKPNGRIRALYLGAHNIQTLTVAQDTFLGSVAGAGAERINIVVGNGNTLTLTGTDINAVLSANTKNAKNHVVAFAGGAGIAQDTYTGLGEIDFAGNAGTLAIGANANIILNNTARLRNYANATLQVDGNLTVGSSFASIKTINIANNKALHFNTGMHGNLELQRTKGDQINFTGANSRLELTNSHNAAHSFIIRHDALGGGVDGNGIVVLHATHEARTLSGHNVANNTIGKAHNLRINELTINGNKNATIGTKVFAKTITINNTKVHAMLGDGVTFNELINTGNGGKIVFGAASEVNFNEDVTSNIDFNNHAGKVNLANNKTITGTVDSAVGANGTLTFLGIGRVTGNIGANNALTAVNFNGAGAVALDAPVKATTFTIGHANANAIVTATGLMTGDVVFGAGGGTLNANGGIKGNLNVSNAGVANIGGGNITGNVGIVTGSVTAAAGATIGGFLTVGAGGDALFVGTNASHVNGAVTINTTNAGNNVIGNAGNAVTLTAGNLNMGNATHGGQDVTVDGGVLNIGTVWRDLFVNGGRVDTLGNVAGDVVIDNGTVSSLGGAIWGRLAVSNGGTLVAAATDIIDPIGLFLPNNFTGAVTVQDVTAGPVMIAAGATGVVTMRNATHAGSKVTVSGGTLNIGTIAQNLVVNKGGQVTTLGNVTGNVTIDNGAVASLAATIGGTLNVTNGGLFAGGAASHVNGAVVINTNNVGINRIGDAGNTVTLTAVPLNKPPLVTLRSLPIVAPPAEITVPAFIVTLRVTLPKLSTRPPLTNKSLPTVPIFSTPPSTVTS